MLVTDQLGAGRLLENPQGSPRTAGTRANLTLKRRSRIGLEQVQVICPTESGEYLKLSRTGTVGRNGYTPRYWDAQSQLPKAPTARNAVSSPTLHIRWWVTLDEILTDSLPRVCPVRSAYLPCLASIPSGEDIPPA
jgi:hypothetical protein